MASSILPLPTAVVAQIRSSITITSLKDVVLELLKNSLDASAHKVDITVDFARGGCVIEDDGLGIPPAEFEETGGLGKLYHTSKHQSPTSTHGTYGRFLASLVALALVSITSCHHKYHSHNTVSIHNSDVITRQTPSSLQQQRITLSNHGTRVAVRNLFGSMPVRVKQRGIMGNAAGVSKQWDSLIKSVIALILAWDKPVSVSIQDATNGQKFRIRGDSNNFAWRKGTVDSTCSILSQASLISTQSWSSWVPILASTPTIRITGLVSTEPAPAKHIQFLSFGIRPLSSTCGYGGLYDEINQMFTNSSFGNEESIKSENDKEERDGYTIRELKGLGKGVDRWPKFYLNIDVVCESVMRSNRGNELVDDEHSGILSSITELLIATVAGFLKQYNFRPKKVRKHNMKAGGGSSASKPDSVLRAPVKTTFSSWTRSKTGASTVTKSKSDMDDSVLTERSSTAPPIQSQTDPIPRSSSMPHHITPQKMLDRSGKIVRQPFGDVADFSRQPSNRTVKSNPPSVGLQETPGNAEDDADKVIVWNDPATKISHRVNSRTGMIINEHRGLKRLSTAPTGQNHKGLAFRKRNKLDDVTSPSEKPEWLHNFLKNWKNPVYNPTEQPIPRIDFEGPNLGIQSVFRLDEHHCSDFDASEAFQSVDLNSIGRLSKSGLKHAEVIAQVDKKFILVKVPQSTSIDTKTQINEADSFLVIIDQHAADERCRIEQLMSEFCKPPSTADVPLSTSGSTPGILAARLEKPIIFEVSPREQQLLQKHIRHFVNWGIVCDLASATGTSKTTEKVVVKALPPAIIERCKMDPKIVIELIRSEIWVREGYNAESRGKSPLDDEHTGVEEEKHGWLKRIHDCPKGLVDLLNSRSCRTAIMFNDYLTPQQCQTLVSRLAECAFPFQCAHGRPSMVPLLAMQAWKDVVLSGVQSVGSRSDFAGKFRRWKEAM